MRFQTHDGELLEGSSFKEIIEQLRLGSRFASEQSELEFMNGFKIRWHEYSGNEIKGEDHESWVKSLMEAGYMAKIDT